MNNILFIDHDLKVCAFNDVNIDTSYKKKIKHCNIMYTVKYTNF